MKTVSFLFFVWACSFCSAQNVLISNQYNGNEPSIMFDPKNPAIQVAGSNTNNVYYSSDSGKTWTVRKLYSSYSVMGDPAIVVDTNGHFYYIHLTSWQHNLDRIVCQKSTDGGKTWNDGTYMGLNGTKMQDKGWMTVNPKTNHLYVTWTQFDEYGSPNPKDSSVILFSKSTDGAATWSAAKRISFYAGDCIDEDQTVEGATLAVGAKGELYVAWAGPKGLVFNKSLDNGETWMKVEKTIAGLSRGWDLSVSGIMRANGLPVVSTDLSGGPYHGRIYVSWSDQVWGPEDTDVFYIKSDDGGETWSTPFRVNDDNGHTHQFFHWSCVDQSNGHYYFVFYDRRYYDSDSTDVFLAKSVNGGESFFNKRISESAFLPTPNIFFGDYNNITAHNGIVRPIWTRLNNGQLSVWTDVSNMNKGGVSVPQINQENSAYAFEAYPNPSHTYTFISFKLRHDAVIQLKILDQLGRVVKTIYADKEVMAGKYIERIDVTELVLQAGVYTIKLEVNGVETITQSLVVE